MSWIDELAEAAREAGEKAEEWANENRDRLEELGQDALDKVLMNVRFGRLNAAQRVWLEEVASHEDRLDAMGEATADLVTDHEEWEALKEDIAAALGDLTSEMAKILLAAL